MNIVTIIGARPQFIKAATISKAIADFQSSDGEKRITEEIIHTGQHYDENMSAVFFDQLGVPEPAVHMELGGRTHGAMTGRMLEAVEAELIERKPNWVLLYGDTNSTLAGALAAVKLHIPVAHVEAGLRSFNKRMPEEINRIMTDHAASLLFCPTNTAVTNLKKEGITQGVHHVGDVMYDAALLFSELAEKQSSILETVGLRKGSFYLATVHRQENTDDPGRLERILHAFERIASEGCPLVLPLHPRTKNALEKTGLQFKNPGVLLIPPVSFLDMVMLEKHAKTILTDSGGVQKEAYFHGVPCVTLRDETEWVETVEAGWNHVVGADADAILRAVASARPGGNIVEYGEGSTAFEIVTRLVAS
jgi:UDP-GlcNAc3NAcA epimerase